MTLDKTQSIYQVVMPRLGLTMTQAQIVQWLHEDGAQIEKGQPLFVIENEKATLDIEAPAGGRLKILQPAGSVVPILQPVALLEGAGEVGTHHALAGSAPVVAVHGPDSPASASLSGTMKPLTETNATVRATPKARALARRLGFELRGITGGGPRGMVTADDVLKSSQGQSTAHTAAAHASPLARKLATERGLDLNSIAGSGPNGWIMRQDVELLTTASLPAPAIEDHQDQEPASPFKGSVTPLSGLRAVIAGRLANAWRDRPQVTLNTEADATALVLARQGINAEVAQSGSKVSFDAILIKLAALALAEMPYMNARWTDDGILIPAEVNIGVAVDTDRGLLVPVVRAVPQKSLRQINQELGPLVARARQGKCLPEELAGGTFTITNLGMYEVDAFTPVINPPECAILGVGRIVAKPVGWNGQVVLREMITLSLSFDHRMVDGAPAARFLQRMKQLVERPFVLAFGE